MFTEDHVMSKVALKVMGSLPEKTRYDSQHVKPDCLNLSSAAFPFDCFLSLCADLKTGSALRWPHSHICNSCGSYVAHISVTPLCICVVAVKVRQSLSIFVEGCVRTVLQMCVHYFPWQSIYLWTKALVACWYSFFEERASKQQEHLFTVSVFLTRNTFEQEVDPYD